MAVSQKTKEYEPKSSIRLPARVETDRAIWVMELVFPRMVMDTIYYTHNCTKNGEMNVVKSKEGISNGIITTLFDYKRKQGL